jgi:hypothetical protein
MRFMFRENATKNPYSCFVRGCSVPWSGIATELGTACGSGESPRFTAAEGGGSAGNDPQWELDAAGKQLTSP